MSHRPLTTLLLLGTAAFAGAVAPSLTGLGAPDGPQAPHRAEAFPGHDSDHAPHGHRDGPDRSERARGDHHHRPDRSDHHHHSDRHEHSRASGPDAHRPHREHDHGADSRSCGGR